MTNFNFEILFDDKIPQFIKDEFTSIVFACVESAEMESICAGIKNLATKSLDNLADNIRDYVAEQTIPEMDDLYLSANAEADDDGILVSLSLTAENKCEMFELSEEMQDLLSATSDEFASSEAWKLAMINQLSTEVFEALENRE